MSQPRRADICVVALAELFRDDGKILAHPIGLMPTLAARLARATFEPDLLVSDGEAHLVAGVVPFGATAKNGDAVEGWLPYRTVFDICFAGRRHVIMGASQLDSHGNQNIACIGDWRRPKAQLLGVRGAPGNTINHATSYWVPKHSLRTLVERVDFVSGVGTDRAAALGRAGRFAEVRAVVTDLAALDFEGAGGTMRVRSLHPGVAPDDVAAATGFELEIPDDVATSRLPTSEELQLLDRLDPDGLRHQEVPG